MMIDDRRQMNQNKRNKRTKKTQKLLTFDALGGVLQKNKLEYNYRLLKIEVETTTQKIRKSQY